MLAVSSVLARNSVSHIDLGKRSEENVNQALWITHTVGEK